MIHERSPCVQREGISRTLTRAPTWANPDSIGCVFICINLRTGPGRTHNECALLCRSDSNDTTWFVALAEEQLTASPCGRPSDNRFHRRLLSRHQPLLGITSSTALDIPQDCRPERRSLNASGSAESAEAVASSCLLLLLSAVRAFAASLAAISARIELWLS